MTATISKVCAFPNGMVMVFDLSGEQLPEYQGLAEEVEPLLEAVGWPRDQLAKAEWPL